MIVHELMTYSDSNSCKVRDKGKSSSPNQCLSQENFRHNLSRSMIGENRQLVTVEPVEFEK